MFGKEERSLLAAEGTQIKPLAGERSEVVMTAARIAAADAGYTFPVVTAGEKVLSNSLDFAFAVRKYFVSHIEYYCEIGTDASEKVK